MNFSDGENDAAETAALAVDVLGRGIDDAIGAERERRLEDRRREHVVDHELGPGVVGDGGDGGDVEHLQGRIGRAFQEEHLGVGPHRATPVVEIEPVDEGRGDAEPRQEVLHHPAARAEQRLGGDDVIAGLDLPDHRIVHRRHAARGGARGLGAFERGHAGFEHVDGRIGEARIQIARLGADEARLALLGAVVDEALGEKQRLRRFAELRAQRAGVDQAGLGMQGLGLGLRSPGTRT